MMCLPHLPRISIFFVKSRTRSTRTPKNEQEAAAEAGDKAT